MTLATREVTSGQTLRPMPPPRPPTLQTVEEFYSRMPAFRRRSLTVQVIGPDGLPYRSRYAIYVEAQLNRLLELPKGWDGRHAKPTTEEALRTTVHLLFAISNEHSISPQFFPLSDGGIQFEWHVAGAAIEIEVEGSGEAYAVVLDESRKVVFEDEVTLEKTATLAALQKFVTDLSGRAAGIR